MKKAKKLWGDLTPEQTREIVEGAGERTIHYGHFFSCSFPFIHRYKDTLVFGGSCGCCGRWNWQWCQKDWTWTAPCKQCVDDSKDFDLEAYLAKKGGK